MKMIHETSAPYLFHLLVTSVVFKIRRNGEAELQMEVTAETRHYRNGMLVVFLKCSSFSW